MRTKLHHVESINLFIMLIISYYPFFSSSIRFLIEIHQTIYQMYEKKLKISKNVLQLAKIKIRKIKQRKRKKKPPKKKIYAIGETLLPVFSTWNLGNGVLTHWISMQKNCQLFYYWFDMTLSMMEFASVERIR